MDYCPDDDDFDPLESLLGELRTLARQAVYSSLQMVLSSADAALLVAEIDRLRALVATMPPMALTLMDEADEPTPAAGLPPGFTDDIDDLAAGFEPDELPRW